MLHLYFFMFDNLIMYLVVFLREYTVSSLEIISEIELYYKFLKTAGTCMAEEKQNEKKINRCVCGRINDLNGIS